MKLKETNDNIVCDAVDKVLSISDDPAAWYAEFCREKAENDYYNHMSSAYKDGIDEGRKEGRKEGRQENLREMLASCITLRFPRIAQTTLDGILSIADSDVLKSIFNVACTADSLDNFQRDVRAMAPTI